MFVEVGALLGLDLLRAVVSYFPYNDTADMGLSVLAVLVFSGLIFLDVQLLMEYGIWHISSLYSNIVTLFLVIMRICQPE